MKPSYGDEIWSNNQKNMWTMDKDLPPECKPINGKRVKFEM